MNGAEQVRRYYDRHTPAFVAFGQRGSDGAIHRAVWGPGTTHPRQAFRYIEDQIVKVLESLPPLFGSSTVVDLGCGVGASLCYLAGRLPLRGRGITLSPVQVRLAQERIRKSGFADRVQCIEADYCDLPAEIGPVDLAYAIESFAHVTDPARFFAECRRLVRPGGRLLICDDFLRPTTESRAAQVIGRFRRGWHINTLLEREQLRVLAADAGFEHEVTSDLSPYLELRRMRDRIADVMLSLVDWLPLQATRFGYLSGGSALQTCLERRWIGYDLVLFRRVG
jgi:cyclopropane fatty-acyl-phospholipid synthase-like methyltransferase